MSTIEADLMPLNFGLHTACRHAPTVALGGMV